VQLQGYNDEKALFRYQEHAFMTMKLFELWADQIFFPEIEKRRTLRGYQGPALLILDGLSSHQSDNFLE
jgi:hypothetical protein